MQCMAAAICNVKYKIPFAILMLCSLYLLVSCIQIAKAFLVTRKQIFPHFQKDHMIYSDATETVKWFIQLVNHADQFLNEQTLCYIQMNYRLSVLCMTSICKAPNNFL